MYFFTQDPWTSFDYENRSLSQKTLRNTYLNDDIKINKLGGTYSHIRGHLKGFNS